MIRTDNRNNVESNINSTAPKTRTLSYVELHPMADGFGCDVVFIGEEAAVNWMRKVADREHGCQDCYRDDEEALEDFMVVYWAKIEDEGS